MNKKVYLDNAATTYVATEVLNEMMPCFNVFFGNPNSIHSFGREAQGLVDRARDRIAKAIGAKSNEIYFTSGGTEADNWAIKGIAHAYANKGRHIITSQIEHPAIMGACKALEKEGFEVTYLPVDKHGLVDLAELIHQIRTDTTLVSIMAVNNEVGTIQNIKAIGKICKENNVIFHTDAVQAFGALKLDVVDMEIDAMSISSHKIYGPKGVGALYVRNGIRIENLIDGGHQERNKRGGTTNVPAVVGFGKAAEITVRDLAVYNQKMKSLRDYFVKQINAKIPYVVINGHPHQKANNIVNISFELIEGESILLLLDFEGIAVSTGSACTSGALEPSHVLKAMGVEDETSQGSIRFSFGRSTTKADIDYTVEKLVEVVGKLRKMSPQTKSAKKGDK
ncbi:MAG: cysteine desulfurase NifS [Firmicutes bacterium]|nr:cysteine desulfurase NifS [Bacillota bacterium]MDY3658735.1 cysteine desulfurase NifS [Eubacteriales bacterium]